jgi:cation diffusion facilitator CzcD-associated flavoprotein CzcO
VGQVQWGGRGAGGGVRSGNRTGAPTARVGATAAAIRSALERGVRSPRVAILGAGAGGLCAAVQLRAAGIETFTIYERSEGVGGTWRDNSYPGAGCDVPSHLYSFSFAPKVDWSRRYAYQPEILGYFEGLVERYGLGPHLRLRTEVTAATWDDATSTWTVELGDGSTETADVVISGLGQLNRPHVPDIPGLEDFAGTWFHSARWDHDHDLRGERVAVIGIGASAIQFVPQVAKDARQLVLFQRSSNYVAPKNDRAFRAWERWLLANVPGVERAYRESIYWRLEARFAIMRRGSRLGRILRGRFQDQLRPLVSQRLTEEALIPDYPPGCKRILIADDWYPTLLRPTVSVVTDRVERITPTGVVDGTGREWPADTIIFGTGFRTTEFLAPLRVRGRAGADLNEAWAGGARAYLGVSVPSFPNLFLLYGPNTNLGHNSILFMIEQQVAYTLSMLAAAMEQGAAAVDVRPEAAERFDAEVQAAAAGTVWADDCHSWYKTEDGRITNNWTDHTTTYRTRLAVPDLSDWELLPAREPLSAG